MKKLIPPEQQSRTISHIIVIAAGMGMLPLLLYFREFWGVITSIFNVSLPFLIGFALAFLQLPIVRKVEWVLNKFLFKRKKRPRLTRALSTTVSLLCLLAILAAFGGIMLPQMIESIKSLVTTITAFINANAHHLEDVLVRWDFITFEGEELIIAWEKILSETSNYITFVVDNVMAIGTTIYTAIFQPFVVLIPPFYLLMDKERFCNQA